MLHTYMIGCWQRLELPGTIPAACYIVPTVDGETRGDTGGQHATASTLAWSYGPAYLQCIINLLRTIIQLHHDVAHILMDSLLLLIGCLLVGQIWWSYIHRNAAVSAAVVITTAGGLCCCVWWLDRSMVSCMRRKALQKLPAIRQHLACSLSLHNTPVTDGQAGTV